MSRYHTTTPLKDRVLAFIEAHPLVGMRILQEEFAPWDNAARVLLAVRALESEGHVTTTYGGLYRANGVA